MLTMMLLLAGSVPPDLDDDRRKSAPAASASAKDEEDRPRRKAVQEPSLRTEVDREDEEEGRAQPDSPIVVTARKLDAARTQIDAALGSTVYALTNDTIENRPGGETGSISDVLAQAPGVTLSGRTLNVRGSPANQVRINNVIVPEAVADPADQLSSRLAETTRLITGTLPAQFGFAPAGVISITTKNGLYQHGGQAEFFAGSDGMIEPALEWAGSTAGTSLFASGSFERDRSTVADKRGVGARDRRNEAGGLGFADHVLDDEDRISLIVGGSQEHDRIGATTIGPGTAESGNGYVVGTFQHSGHDFTVQASAFAGLATDRARFSTVTWERRDSFGTQIDASNRIGSAHTLRFGLLASRSAAREGRLDGDRSRSQRSAIAVYGQDEWKISPALTFNPGARLEWLRGFGSDPKLEPRASLVWQSEGGSTAHVGYARYASSPALGEPRASASLPDERDDYFDAGVQQTFGSLTIGLDGYWRSVGNYLAEHDTIGSAVPTAFTFKRARTRGAELSATYAHGPATAWANLSVISAKARTTEGGEGLFSPEAIAAASRHFLSLASERPVTASAGMTWRVDSLSLSADVLASSGAVRTVGSDQPNGSRHSPYAVLGLAAVYRLRIVGRPADLRLDLTNLTNAHYFTSEAANLEGGWSRRGHPRAVTIGIEQGF